MCVPKWLELKSYQVPGMFYVLFLSGDPRWSGGTLHGDSGMQRAERIPYCFGAIRKLEARFTESVCFGHYTRVGTRVIGYVPDYWGMHPGIRVYRYPSTRLCRYPGTRVCTRVPLEYTVIPYKIPNTPVIHQPPTPFPPCASV